MNGARGVGRLRSFLWFALSLIYVMLAEQVSEHAANGLAAGDWFALADRGIFLFLLVVGFAALAYTFQKQRQPLRSMGLVRRAGWSREFGIGAALGWGLMLVCVLPIAIFGNLTVTFWHDSHQIFLLLLDLAILAVDALAVEIAFRGYPFQRLVEAIGPTMATVLMTVVYALTQLHNPSLNSAGVMTSILAGWLLSMGYLRTRALWLPWGLHFAWNASMGALFGLPISGITNFSPVIQSSTAGPLWLTGGEYGPEGGLIAAIVLIVGLVVLYRVTEDYAYQYAQPVIVAGGIPVDIDRAAQQQHDVAMASPAAPSAPQLIQIAPPPPAIPPPVSRVGSEPAIEHAGEARPAADWTGEES
jgi:membrane protease YdiL (CAAX protease family)